MGGHCKIQGNLLMLWFQSALFVSFQSLLLLSYLILNGSERVVTSAREHIYDLRSLESYTFMDELNRDQGLNGKKQWEMIDQ